MHFHMTKQVLSRTSSKHALLCTRLKPAATHVPEFRMLIVTLLILVALAVAEHIPLSAAQPSENRPFPEGSCTFTLWHRQQESVNYVQLNTIWDYSNDITVDVAALQPTTSFNSYVRLDESHAFAVTGLLDKGNLTITRLRDGDLAFKVGEAEWSTQSFWRRKGESGKWTRAGCNAGDWEGNAEARVSGTAPVKTIYELTCSRSEN